MDKLPVMIDDVQIEMRLIDGSSNGRKERAVIHASVGSKIYGNMYFYQGGDGQFHVDFPPQYRLAKDLRKQIRRMALEEYDRMQRLSSI